MRVWLDPDRLQSLGMTATTSCSALQGQNVQVASGVLNQPPVDQARRVPDCGADARAGSPIPTSSATSSSSRPPNAVVRLKDVATVELAALDYSSNSYLDRDPAVALAIFQRPGSNALATAQGDPHDDGRSCRKRFPPGVEIRHRLQSDPVHPAVGRRGAWRRSARRSCWSCWWSSCSCRPGAPPSSRSSPFRCR